MPKTGPPFSVQNVSFPIHEMARMKLRHRDQTAEKIVP